MEENPERRNASGCIAIQVLNGALFSIVAGSFQLFCFS